MRLACFGIIEEVGRVNLVKGCNGDVLECMLRYVWMLCNGVDSRRHLDVGLEDRIQRAIARDVGRDAILKGRVSKFVGNVKLLVGVSDQVSRGQSKNDGSRRRNMPRIGPIKNLHHGNM